MNAKRSIFLTTLPLALAGLLAATPFATAQTTSKQAEVKTKMKTKEKAAPAAALIDLNSASSEELKTLPGVGDATARKIIDSRPHKTFADLSKAGINEATIAKLKPGAEIKPLPEPIDVNADSPEQIQKLPGVGAVLAKEIVAARPLKTYEDLGKLKGIGAEKLDVLKGRVKFGEMAAPKDVVKTKSSSEKTVVTKGMTKEKGETVTKEKVTKEKIDTAEDTSKYVSKVPPGKKINLNTATKDELQLLWGIGETRSQEIIDARPFKTIEDIKKIKGIKDFEFEKIKDVITVK